MKEPQPSNSHESLEQPDNIFEFLNLSIDSGKELRPRDFHEALAHKEITKEEHDELLSKLIENSQKSHRDPLTGISNRRSLNRELTGAMGRLNASLPEGEKSGRRQASTDYILFFFIDADKFKQINDTYGYHKGDEVLKLIAGCLEEEAMERRGKAARFGGDEFAFLQEGLGDITEGGVQVISLRIQEKINSYLSGLATGEINFSVSVGGAILKRGENKTVEQLTAEANVALKKNKLNKT